MFNPVVQKLEVKTLSQLDTKHRYRFSSPFFCGGGGGDGGDMKVKIHNSQ